MYFIYIVFLSNYKYAWKLAFFKSSHIFHSSLWEFECWESASQNFLASSCLPSGVGNSNNIHYSLDKKQIQVVNNWQYMLSFFLKCAHTSATRRPSLIWMSTENNWFATNVPENHHVPDCFPLIFNFFILLLLHKIISFAFGSRYSTMAKKELYVGIPV